jgi:immune inhibitor A
MRGSFGAAMLVAMALALSVGTAAAAPGGATGKNGYVNRVSPADPQVEPDLFGTRAGAFGRDTDDGAAKAELGYPPAARALARREALANKTGKSPRTIARTQQGMPNVQHARLLVIPVEFNPNANDDFSGYERYDANDPSGCVTEPAGTVFNGPTHNQIPDPAKTGHDNNTLWVPDFSPD